MAVAVESSVGVVPSLVEVVASLVACRVVASRADVALLVVVASLACQVPSRAVVAFVVVAVALEPVVVLLSQVGHVAVEPLVHRLQ